MQKKFLSNLFFLIVVNLLVKPFWILGIDREVQNQVGAEVYGSYFALFNLSLILNILLDLGITNYNNRQISQHGHLLGKYFSRIVALRMVLAVAYALLCLVMGLIFGYDADQMSMLGLLCFNQFLLSFILFLRSNVAGLQLFRIDSMLSILDRTIVIITCGILLWGGIHEGPFQIAWFVQLQTLGLFITAVIALAVVLRYGGRFHRSWNSRIFPLILRQSLPFALLILLMSIYGRIDSVMLERLLPDGNLQSGIYAQAFRLLDAANMIGYLFAVLLLPMFSRMLKQKDDVRSLTALGSKILLIPAFSLAIMGYWHGTALMDLLYDHHVSSSGAVLSILLFSFVPMAGTYVYGTLLTANGSLRWLNYIAAAGVVLSVVINLIVIPKYGPFGAAVACLVTQLVTFLLQYALAVRTFKISFTVKGSIGPIVAVALIGLAGMLSAHLPWMLASCLVILLGGLCTLLLILPDLKLLRSEAQ